MGPGVQITPLKIPLASLLSLQAVDDKIQGFSRQRKKLDEKVAASKATLEAAKGKQEKAKEAFGVQKKRRSLLELDVKVKEDDILKYNSQLNECKTNEAYSAKLSEISTAKKTKKEIEENIIQLMEGEEASQKEYDEQAKILEEDTRAAEKIQADAMAEYEGLDKDMELLKGERATLIASLDKAHSELYERRRESRSKIIAIVVDEKICTACSMKVPPHQIHEIRKYKSFQHCQSCGVILAMPEAS